MLFQIRGRLTREATLEKIKRETDMMERLQGCAGVVRLLELFEDETSVQIVTELCPGGDLQKFVEKHGPLDERSLAQVAYEVLKMVKCCHDLGVVHGDVKPANFCLKHAKRPHANGEGKATWVLRAIDFGCSQPLPGERRGCVCVLGGGVGGAAGGHAWRPKGARAVTDARPASCPPLAPRSWPEARQAHRDPW